ncbi:hypothetical protein ACVGWI_00645, partial [Enterobacter hormaechei]
FSQLKQWKNGGNMEDCQEWSECGAAVSPSPGGAALTRPNVSRKFWPGKAKPPPGTKPLAKNHHPPQRQPFFKVCLLYKTEAADQQYCV